MMLTVPPNAPKRYFPVDRVTGLDALLGIWPALQRRVLAIKLLRAWGELPKNVTGWRILWAMFVRVPRQLEKASLGFSYGGMWHITDTAGRTAPAPHS